MNKILFIIPILLLFAACSSTQLIQLEEVNSSTESQEIITIEETELPEPYYNISEGETIKILDKTITLKRIYQNPEIVLLVDGTEYTIKQTKQQEIIEDITAEIILTNTDDLKNSYIVIKLEPLNLNDNEYIIRKNEITNVGTKDIILSESSSDGSIKINVYNKDTTIGYTENLNHGETATTNGLAVTNIKNYYLVNQYAIVQIETS